MKFTFAKHKMLWSDKFFVVSTMVGLLFFAGALFVNYGAVRYSTKVAGNATTDILLQNLPVVNTDIVFSEGAIMFVIFVAVLLALDPKVIPFTFKSVATFIFVRSLFMTMTHLAPPSDGITTNLERLSYISPGSDLFFSGHTGLPFLMALLFWEKKYLRWIFLGGSVVGAAAVILGHLHYTIDVFSAFFITYGIYRISQNAFKKDYKLFTYGLPRA